MAPLPLSAPLNRVTTQAIDRKSARLGALLGHWEDVVGPRFGALSFPVRLTPGSPGKPGPVLTVAVPPAWSTEFRHEVPVLLSRINAFFGGGAVREIKLVSRRQSVARKYEEPPPPVEDTQTVAAEVASIEDERLREALLKLGLALKSKPS